MAGRVVRCVSFFPLINAGGREGGRLAVIRRPPLLTLHQLRVFEMCVCFGLVYMVV